MERKTFKFEVKEIDENAGTFEGYGATFSDKPDSYGDLIDPGAFTKTLKEGGKRIKILWQHNINEPIGKPTEIVVDEKGLHVKAKLSLGVQRAREVLCLMKDGVITDLSIGYDALKQTFTEGIRHLKEVKVYDISPVVFAANAEAVILGVKTAIEPTEGKPYPNEHACRLNSPDKYEEFRRGKRESDGKEYSIIFGKLKDEQDWEEQAYRYAKDVWDADEARSHCEKHNGTFEPAERELEPAKTTLFSEADKEAAELLEGIINTLKSESEGFSERAAEARIEAILAELKEG